MFSMLFITAFRKLACHGILKEGWKNRDNWGKKNLKLYEGMLTQILFSRLCV